jgi:hypothetical protein
VVPTVTKTVTGVTKKLPDPLGPTVTKTVKSLTKTIKKLLPPLPKLPL